MTAAETLQAAADELRFDWLRALSTLITELDELDRQAEHLLAAGVERAAASVGPPDAGSSFRQRARYLRVLEEHPVAVLAHRDVAAGLNR